MKILGMEGMTPADVSREVERGARFVIFQYCVSIIVLTFKRPSHIYFVRGGQSRVIKGLPFAAVSLLFGWWGIPWGPIHTVTSLTTDFQGGKDVTQHVLASLQQTPSRR